MSLIVLLFADDTLCKGETPKDLQLSRNCLLYYCKHEV